MVTGAATASPAAQAGSHSGCVRNLSHVAAIAKGGDSFGRLGVPLAGAGRLFSGLNGGAGSALGMLMASGGGIAAAGHLAQLLSQSRAMARLTGTGATLRGNFSGLLGRLRTLLGSTTRSLPALAPELPLQLELMTAAKSLTERNINVFTDRGVAALSAYIGRVQSGGMAGMFADPRLSGSLGMGLLRFGALSESMGTLGFGIGQGGMSTLPNLSAMLSEINAGPFGAMLSAEGLALLAGVGGLSLLSLRLAHLRLSRQMLPLLPTTGSGRRTIDPLAALEQNGACAAMRQFANLPQLASGARHLDGMVRGMEAAQHCAGIDLTAPGSAGKLKSWLDKTKQTVGTMPTTGGVLDHPRLADISKLFTAILNSKEPEPKIR